MKRGFTLIELLIVIGILAILATVVVLVLNPAQILAQARDSQRISDLSSVKSALSLYLSTATNPTIPTGGNVTAGTACGFSGQTVCTTVSSTAINGTGWVPVDFTQISGGSPLAALPLDPTNSGSYVYAYKGNSTNKTFKIEGRLESTKYQTLMQSDGGIQNTCSSTFTDSTCWYEIGTDMSI